MVRFGADGFADDLRAAATLFAGAGGLPAGRRTGAFAALVAGLGAAFRGAGFAGRLADVFGLATGFPAFLTEDVAPGRAGLGEGFLAALLVTAMIHLLDVKRGTIPPHPTPVNH